MIFSTITAFEALGYIGTAVGAMVGTLAVVKWLRREPSEVEITGQPLRTSITDPPVPKSVFDKQTTDFERRMASHEVQFNSLWHEITVVRKEATDRHAEVMRSLGRIEGHLSRDDGQ